MANSISESITGKTVMLYYHDLPAARKFYGELLGFKPVLEDDWVTLYEVVPGSYIGTIESDSGYHRAQESSAVMLSFTTDDVDRCFEKLLEVPGISIESDLADSTRVPMRGFIILDPGGYTVEFFQWKKPDTE